GREKISRGSRSHRRASASGIGRIRRRSPTTTRFSREAVLRAPHESNWVFGGPQAPPGVWVSSGAATGTWSGTPAADVSAIDEILRKVVTDPIGPNSRLLRPARHCAR